MEIIDSDSFGQGVLHGMPSRMNIQHEALPRGVLHAGKNI